ncbi:unnamed protein product, partial [Medioppia subpectinata]
MRETRDQQIVYFSEQHMYFEYTTTRMSLKNILSLKKYSFLKQPKGSPNVLLTPLSQQIKQNIAFEWIKSIRKLPSVEMFVTPFITHTEPPIGDQNNMNDVLLKSILDDYNNYYRLWSEGMTETVENKCPQLESIEHISGSSVKTTHPALTDSDIISCQIDLDNSLIAILSDAFTTKKYES